ncbi:MAG: EAL domain-containing protein [Betaproteobacteria bacterium]|nr:EAL domain-containing protein [Betaproteobacteria bacterium]
MNQRDGDTRAAGEPEETVHAVRTRYTRLEYEAVLANASIGIAFTRERRFVLCNPKFEQMLGWERGELIGQPGEVVYPSMESYQALGRIAIPVLSTGRQLDLEWEFRRKDRSKFLARVIAKAIDSADTGQGTIWIAEDITERRDARKRIKRALEEQELILDNATVGIAFVRARVLRRANRHLAQMLGRSVDELTGKSTAILFASEKEWEEGSRRAYEGTVPGETHEAEVRFKRADGTTFLCRAVGRRIDAESGDQEWIWSFEDVTAEHAARVALARSHDELERLVAERTTELQATNRKLAAEIAERAQAERLAQHLADHDALTGLPNRRILEDRLTQAIALSRRNRKQTAVMFVDLDRFKQVNDSLGHAVGDALLKETAERLSGQLRVGDTICRIGGDEFVVVLPEVKRSADPANVARKIIEKLSLPFLIEGHELSITPSLGISVYPDDGLDAESLIRNADAAMYHAKEAGRANYQFFTEQMNLAAGRRIALETDLRRALHEDELQVFYQPLAALATRREVSREALLRWAHPARGLLEPGRFMGVAEDTGLMVKIGERVLRSACVWTMGLDDSRRLPVSINLSLRQFGDPRLLDMVSRVLAETGLPAGLLGFEISESTLMHQTDHTLARLGKLKDMGVSLCVDAFGTGQSSLKFLKRFPVDRIKIDRSFLAGVPGDADDCAVVTAIAGLARNLKLEVVAVGVESEEQLVFLAQCGCDLVQGYAIGESRSADTAAETIGIQRDMG